VIRRVLIFALVLPGLASLAVAQGASSPAVDTTSGAIALANLDHLIAQRTGAQADGEAADELWLMRARYLADYAALDRGAACADAPAPDVPGLLRRARARAAVHRFSAALADLDAAARLGADAATLFRLRAPIRIAQGAADEVIAPLEAAAAREHDFANAGALAIAYAGAGRFADADREFQAALDALDTTSPFPYAWLSFARGTMWAEQAGDADRGARHLRRALDYLPQFVAANLHLAEIEARRGDAAAASARLERVAERDDPEVLALLGRLHAASDPARGASEIERARARFESLLARQPLAFADHAAEFYLGAGADPQRAWRLASANFAERKTPRARELLERAAHAQER
jgi:tetratricopeptide (TPR) repeat protein